MSGFLRWYQFNFLSRRAASAAMLGHCELVFRAFENLRQRRLGGENAACEEKEKGCAQRLKRFHLEPLKHDSNSTL
jgi:hypothetical protein